MTETVTLEELRPAVHEYFRRFMQAPEDFEPLENLSDPVADGDVTFEFLVGIIREMREKAA